MSEEIKAGTVGGLLAQWDEPVPGEVVAVCEQAVDAFECEDHGVESEARMSDVKARLEEIKRVYDYEFWITRRPETVDHDHPIWLISTCESLSAEVESYKDFQQDVHRLTRELDVIWNREHAAKQASLCDMVTQIRVDIGIKDAEVATLKAENERLQGELALVGQFQAKYHAELAVLMAENEKLANQVRQFDEDMNCTGFNRVVAERDAFKAELEGVEDHKAMLNIAVDGLRKKRDQLKAELARAKEDEQIRVDAYF